MEDPDSVEDVVFLAGDMAWEYGLALGTLADGYIDSIGYSMQAVRDKHGTGEAFYQMRKQVDDWIKSRASMIDVAIHEIPTIANMNSALGQFGVVATFLSVAAEYDASKRIIAIHPSHLKKRVTGSGRAEKPEMMRAAEEYSGREMKDHNEADAVCLLQVGIEDYIQRKQSMGKK